jgi:hypothetical protein
MAPNVGPKSQQGMDKEEEPYTPSVTSITTTSTRDKVDQPADMKKNGEKKSFVCRSQKR